MEEKHTTQRVFPSTVKLISQYGETADTFDRLLRKMHLKIKELRADLRRVKRGSKK